MYRSLYRHLLSRMDAEWIHGVALSSLAAAGAFPLSRALLQRLFAPYADSSLRVQAFGLRFAHPLGLAAGFDKDGTALRGLAALGFSFIEVGTVTPQPQAGNPKPRLFRLLEDRALINRLGFPSSGMVQVAHNLRWRPATPIAISLGKNKETPLGAALRDYRAVLEHLYAYGDLFVVNVSSPNTPELRRLQSDAYLNDLLAGLRQSVDAQPVAKPLLLKIAPDLSLDEIEVICALALQNGISGIIATNTMLERPPNLRSVAARESGGLSGAPLRDRSTAIVQYIHRVTEGKLPVIGVGGVFSGADLWAKLCAGATLVQAYTGFVYEGLAFVKRALRELKQIMAAEGVRNLNEIIGKTD
ncbi:MAG: quinone-dependent dihydroorotate dehydrogenase [Anaerolineae bacterium]|nr:quinone-dependent dihydroorotate dehydrogenase [Anaerolineae bacterium]